MPAQKTTSNTPVIDVFFHLTCFCAAHVLSSVFPQVAEEDVGTATSGDRAEFFSVTNQSDNTSGLKAASAQTDQRPHHFLANLKAAPPNTQVEAEIFLHKMLTPGGLHADAGLSHICEKNDGALLFADKVVQSMRLNFSERSRVWRRRRQACTCATGRERSCSSTVA